MQKQSSIKNLTNNKNTFNNTSQSNINTNSKTNVWVHKGKTAAETVSKSIDSKSNAVPENKVPFSEESAPYSETVNSNSHTSETKVPFSDSNNKIALGSSITVTTKDGQIYNGDLFSYDPTSRLVIIVSVPSSTSKIALPTELRKFDFNILNLDSISSIVTPENIKVKSIQFSPMLEVKSSTGINQWKSEFNVSNLNMDKLALRERNAIRNINEQIKRVGKQVSPFAQSLFDGLCKTLPCRWEGKTIVVMEEVLIKEPYDTCQGSGQAVEHVKKIMKYETEKLQNRMSVQ